MTLSYLTFNRKSLTFCFGTIDRKNNALRYIHIIIPLIINNMKKHMHQHYNLLIKTLYPHFCIGLLSINTVS